MSTSERERIHAAWQEAIDRGYGVIKVGGTVICDNCDTDLTDDIRTGGYLFGTYGYGPCCATERLEIIRSYGEEGHIRAYCPPDTSFANWIRAMRSARPGGDEIRVGPLLPKAHQHVAEPSQETAEPTQEVGTDAGPAAPLPYIPGFLEAAVAQHERLRNAKWPASPADGAEPAQETPADQDAETGPAEAPAAAEDAPEGNGDAQVNT